MAHQAHALPWNTFSSQFAYTRKVHIANAYDLYALDKPTQNKEIAHFSKMFAKQMKEFGRTERAKYQPAEIFQERAMTWKISSTEQDTPTSTEDGEKIWTKNGEKKNDKWKSGREKNSSTIEEGMPEKRKVYPDAFKTKYEACYADWIRIAPVTQYIENWMGQERHEDCIDILKILMMEAGVATHPISQRVENDPIQKESMETLLLLSNNPGISRTYWKIKGAGPNYYGINALAEKSVQAYLYFNLLYALRENGSNLCDPLNEDEEKYRSSCFQYVKLFHEIRDGAKMKYMNTRCWSHLMYFLASSNWYNSELLMHRPYLFSNWGTGEGGEVSDPMADLARLREYLKGLWRVLVINEIVWVELGQEVDWEQMISDALSRLVKMNAVYSQG